MANLLHLDASPRNQRSHSRRLSGEFVEAWKQFYPNDKVTYRDVGQNPVPHVDEAWIAAAYTPPEQLTPELREAIRISDYLVDEFLAADIYVIGVPMYNLSSNALLRATIAIPAAPARANAIASSKPNPCEAPVISAYFPCNLLICTPNSP